MGSSVFHPINSLLSGSIHNEGRQIGLIGEDFMSSMAKAAMSLELNWIWKKTSFCVFYLHFSIKMKIEDAHRLILFVVEFSSDFGVHNSGTKGIIFRT